MTYYARSTHDLTNHGRHDKMTISINGTFPTIYPLVARKATAGRQIAAADRARPHALGPWTVGNGSAAGGPLSRLPQLLLASPRPIDVLIAMAAMSMSTRECRVARSAIPVVPTLAGVVRVDRGWVPTAQTARSTSAIICTRCTRTTTVHARRVVSWRFGQRGAGGRGACGHVEPGGGTAHPSNHSPNAYVIISLPRAGAHVLLPW